MEALGQLTGGVAHDFNNLLMIVSSYIPALKQRVANDPKGLHAAEAIELAAQRGATLTRQLLSFSRRQSLNPMMVDLSEVMEAARPILDSVLGGTVQYVTTILPDVWPVRVDLSEFELSIVNMTVNARDAMPVGGTIAVTAENMCLFPGDIADSLAGDFVAVSVAEPGKACRRIFWRKFRSVFYHQGEGKGTGLGLSQVHGFVHQSGGTSPSTVTSGGGTRVTLFLPRVRWRRRRDAPRDVSVDYVAGHSKVLLVEDNPDVADATRELLADMGCETEKVGNAAAALEADEDGEFDLMLSDIVMAGTRTASASPALSGKTTRPSDRPGDRLQRGGRAGGGEFPVLRKPYNVTDLDQAMSARGDARRPGNGRLSISRTTKRERAAKGK